MFLTRNSLFFLLLLFSIGINSWQTKQPIQSIELQEKEDEKDEKDNESWLERTHRKKVLFNFKPKVI